MITVGAIVRKAATVRVSGKPKRQRDLRMPKVPGESLALLSVTIGIFFRTVKAEAKGAAIAYLERLGKCADGDLAKADSASVTIDWADLVKSVEPILASSYKQIGQKAYKQTGASGAFNQVNAAATAYAKKRAAELVGMKWVDGELVDNPNAAMVISDTTRNHLRRLTESAFRDGLSPAELADQIEDLPDFSEARAHAIARTELANVQSSATVKGWKESGMVSKKRWITADDPCPICEGNADAGEIPIDRAFPSGHQQPTAHPNDRCDMVAVLDEEAA